MASIWKRKKIRLLFHTLMNVKLSSRTGAAAQQVSVPGGRIFATGWTENPAGSI